jgi:hypothetical protein
LTTPTNFAPEYVAFGNEYTSKAEPVVGPRSVFAANVWYDPLIDTDELFTVVANVELEIKIEDEFDTALIELFPINIPVVLRLTFAPTLELVVALKLAAATLALKSPEFAETIHLPVVVPRLIVFVVGTMLADVVITPVKLPVLPLNTQRASDAPRS